MRPVAIIAALLLSACVATVDADDDQMIATNATECRQVYNAAVAEDRPDGGVAMIGPLIVAGGLVRVGDQSPTPREALETCYELVDAPQSERILP